MLDAKKIQSIPKPSRAYGTLRGKVGPKTEVLVWSIGTSYKMAVQRLKNLSIPEFASDLETIGGRLWSKLS